MCEDKRIVKTRAILRNTLQQYMETRFFDDVTVKQICENASVSRVTFYSHFADKYALLANLYVDFQNKVTQRCIEKFRKNGKKDDARAYSVDFFVSYAEEVYAGRLNFFRAVFREKGYAYLAFTDMIARTTDEYIKKLTDAYEVDLSYSQITSLLYSGPLDFLKSVVFSEETNAEAAAALCRDYYLYVIDFVLKKHF